MEGDNRGIKDVELRTISGSLIMLAELELRLQAESGSLGTRVRRRRALKVFEKCRSPSASDSLIERYEIG